MDVQNVIINRLTELTVKKVLSQKDVRDVRNGIGKKDICLLPKSS